MKKDLILKLEETHTLSHTEWLELLGDFTDEERDFAAERARELTERRFGRRIYFRGIIEFTNYCRNDCLYCGIRRSNGNAVRYRLTEEEILECCREGYGLGYRTFVLQGGEDAYFTDERLCGLIKRIKSDYPECAVTLSVGERSRESYEALYKSGADRYLLRHETANCHLYGKLHPAELSLSNRMRCLRDLKEIGFQTGAGMMIGAPFSTTETLAEDMEFLADFKPQMVGVGPFIPHKDTPFRDYPSGGEKLTLFVLSLVRLMLPDVLLPATTALGTVDGRGRQLGVLAGCNVVMPNLSPLSVRKKYLLYDGKTGVDSDAAEGLRILGKQMEEIGYEVFVGRGDFSEK